MSEKKVKLNYKQTFLIGFGFLAVMVIWSIYNAYVPLILDEKLRNMGNIVLPSALISTLTGFIMTIDNIFGVIFQPLFGKKSDYTRTRFGKRIPYLLIGMPICAVLFFLIPQMASLNGIVGIIGIMAVVICFNFVMSTWRAPVVALMPDLTPSEVQSDGNAVINLMGGLGSLIGMGAGAIVALFGFKEAVESGQYSSVFAVGSIITIISMLIVFFTIKEGDNRLLKTANQKEAAYEQKKEKEKKQSIKDLKLSKGEKKSFIYMLIGLFFLCNGTEAIQPFFTLFARNVLGIEAIMATLMMGVFAGSLMVFAIPAGIMGRKFGRKKTICAGLILVVTMFCLYMLNAFLLQVEALVMPLLWIALILGGCGVAMVNINTLPVVLAIGGKDRIGAFTGYYYTATFSAAIVAPTLCGALIGLLNDNYNVLFLYCAIAFALGLVFVAKVKHGEQMKGDEEWLEEAVEAAEQD